MKKLTTNPKAIIAGLFTISTFFVLPLFWGHDFRFLFDRKYVYYYVSVLTAVGLYLIAAAAIRLRDKTWDKHRSEAWETALFIFIGLSILSTLFSEFRYEAFWGNEGRYNGLFLLLLYCIPSYLLGRHLNMRKWYLDVMLIAGLLVCLYGISDFFQMDILGAKVMMKPDDKAKFMSTMGNINFYTSYVALSVGCSAGLFLTEERLARQFFYYISHIISLFAIIAGNSDNAYLSLAAIGTLMPLYALRRKRTAKRLFLLFASSLAVMILITRISEKWPDKVLPISSLVTQFGGHPGIIILAAGTGLLTLLAYLKWPGQKTENPQLPPILTYLWLAFIGGIVLLVVYFLYDANLAGNGMRYDALQQFLVFNDHWGTNRGYAWRIAWEYFVQFSPLQKLLGYGLETYPILNIYNNKWEMAFVLESFYDSVHNEYLQYLIGIGILGLISYLAFLVTVSKTLLTNLKKTPWLLGILLPLAAYWSQAVVNISTVYIAAIMWMLIGAGLAVCRENQSASIAVPAEISKPTDREDGVNDFTDMH